MSQTVFPLSDLFAEILKAHGGVRDEADNLLAYVLDRAVTVGIPMRTKFRGTTYREALLVEGPAGWAEFSPFPEYGPEESARWLLAALEIGWLGYPDARREDVPVNATVPAIAASEVEAVLERYAGKLPGTIKVKIAEQPKPGQPTDPAVHGLEADVARVHRVRELAPEALIRVDANRGLNIEDAVELLRELEPVGLEYAEQPVDTTAELAELRRRLAAADIAVPLAADESVRKTGGTEAELAPVREAADLAIIKVQPLGGIRSALAVQEFLSMDVVVSSALDTSVGIRAGMALAAALPELNHACGLGTVTLFSQDVVVEPLVPVDGQLSLADTSAHLKIAPETLAELRLPEVRHEWWLQRVRDAFAALP